MAMVLREILATFANSKIVSRVLYKIGMQFYIFHADTYSTYQLSSLLTLYLCRYLSFRIIFTVYHFITFLNPWKIVWIHRPRSIYSLFIIFVVLPGSMATHWYCGHCTFGPMMIDIHEFCVNCLRQRDSYARYEDLGPSCTASLHQPEPRASATHCGIRGPIAYQQPISEPGAGGLPVQETALAPTRWYCCQGKKVKKLYHGCFFRANGRHRWRWSRVH